MTNISIIGLSTSARGNTLGEDSPILRLVVLNNTKPISATASKHKALSAKNDRRVCPFDGLSRGRSSNMGRVKW
jgi:hypothetical protein